MRAFFLLMTLGWAVPALAANGPSTPQPKAPAGAKPTEAVAQALASTQPAMSSAGGSCCGGGAGKGSCDGDKAKALNPYASDENWREFVRQVYAEAPEEPEPPDVDPFLFSVYRGVRLEPMGAQTLINGARVDVATLIVEEPPYAVMKFYQQALAQVSDALIFGQVEEVPGMTYVSFRPPGSKNLKTITLVPHGEGTVILASVGNPEALIEGRPVLPGDVPLPPNSELPTAIQQMEPGLASRSAVFVVRDSTVEKVQDFYRQELTRRGFSPVTLENGLPGMESYQKGSRMLSLTAKPHADPSSVAVGILWLDE
ncbi:hypothetical protein [Vitiosangium sp. GDMCC 1.1324]|uniref:hypothetical protein n=1 Tax=Vitiosangium sp. (strain GDMCC 1.1324) TaxID=2138576 RepID=UPI0011B36E6D|nr:hypothetical protein [Vitiosangium sp. GDMCC 1.1324]